MSTVLSGCLSLARGRVVESTRADRPAVPEGFCRLDTQGSADTGRLGRIYSLAHTRAEPHQWFTRVTGWPIGPRRLVLLTVSAASRSGTYGSDLHSHPMFTFFCPGAPSRRAVLCGVPRPRVAYGQAACRKACRILFLTRVRRSKLASRAIFKCVPVPYPHRHTDNRRGGRRARRRAPARPARPNRLGGRAGLG